MVILEHCTIGTLVQHQNGTIARILNVRPDPFALTDAQPRLYVSPDGGGWADYWNPADVVVLAETVPAPGTLVTLVSDGGELYFAIIAGMWDGDLYADVAFYGVMPINPASIVRVNGTVAVAVAA
jgi:hypothetical protein